MLRPVAASVLIATLASSSILAVACGRAKSPVDT